MKVEIKIYDDNGAIRVNTDADAAQPFTVTFPAEDRLPIDASGKILTGFTFTPTTDAYYYRDVKKPGG